MQLGTVVLTRETNGTQDEMTPIVITGGCVIMMAQVGSVDEPTCRESAENDSCYDCRPAGNNPKSMSLDPVQPRAPEGGLSVFV
jgi:hypothetical protein